MIFSSRFRTRSRFCLCYSLHSSHPPPVGLNGSLLSFFFLLLLGAGLLLNLPSAEAVEVDIPDPKPPRGAQAVKTFQGKPDGTTVPRHHRRYSPEGRLLSERLYDDKGQPRWRVMYTYSSDSSGNDRNLQMKRAVDEAGREVWRVEYSYDSRGREIRAVHYDLGEDPHYSVVRDYSDDTEETVAYGPYGQVIWRRKRVSYPERNTREISYYHADGTRIKLVIEDYNRQNLITEETHIDEIGTLFRRIETRYDRWGRKTGKTVYNDKDEIHRQVWFEYHPRGHIKRVKQIIPTQDRVEEILYTYKMDNRGEWIERQQVETVIQHGEQQRRKVSRLIREIEYHSSPAS